MAKEMTVELAKYRDIRDWKPAVGDVLIKHGWLSRTKWFGIVVAVGKDGTIDVAVDGTMRLLLTTSPFALQKKQKTLHIAQIHEAIVGSYCAGQYDSAAGTMVWYV